jgi:hypothetical protein
MHDADIVYVEPIDRRMCRVVSQSVADHFGPTQFAFNFNWFCAGPRLLLNEIWAECVASW